jgi:hypothetical protein
MEEILEGNSVGVALKDFDEKPMKNALVRLVELTQIRDIKIRCKILALHNFSLEYGV